MDRKLLNILIDAPLFARLNGGASALDALGGATRNACRWTFVRGVDEGRLLLTP